MSNHRGILLPLGPLLGDPLLIDGTGSEIVRELKGCSKQSLRSCTRDVFGQTRQVEPRTSHRRVDGRRPPELRRVAFQEFQR